MSLSKTLYPLLSTGSNHEDRKTSRHENLSTGRKHQHKQKNGQCGPRSDCSYKSSLI